MPTAAAYFDDRWTIGQMFSNDGTVTKAEDEITTLVVQWPDFGKIDIDVLTRAVEWVQSRLDEGEQVEIGCIAGHGRTGSFAAAMCIVQGLSADDAVLYVKSYYCTKAVESKPQKDMLTALDKEVNGLPSWHFQP